MLHRLVENESDKKEGRHWKSSANTGAHLHFLLSQISFDVDGLSPTRVFYQMSAKDKLQCYSAVKHRKLSQFHYRSNVLLSIHNRFRWSLSFDKVCGAKDRSKITVDAFTNSHLMTGKMKVCTDFKCFVFPLIRSTVGVDALGQCRIIRSATSDNWNLTIKSDLPYSSLNCVTNWQNPLKEDRSKTRSISAVPTIWEKHFQHITDEKRRPSFCPARHFLVSRHRQWTRDELDACRLVEKKFNWSLVQWMPMRSGLFSSIWTRTFLLCKGHT